MKGIKRFGMVAVVSLAVAGVMTSTAIGKETKAKAQQGPQKETPQDVLVNAALSTGDGEFVQEKTVQRELTELSDVMKVTGDEIQGQPPAIQVVPQYPQ